MQKLEGWLFLLIALVWLLQAVNVIIGSVAVHTWIATIAIAIIGILKLKN